MVVTTDNTKLIVTATPELRGALKRGMDIQLVLILLEYQAFTEIHPYS